MKNTSPIIFLFILVLIVVGAWYFDKNYINSKNGQTVGSDTTATQQKTATITSDDLIFISQSENDTKILKNTDGKIEQVSKDNSVVKVGGYASGNQEILETLGQTGPLVFQKISDSKQIKVSDEFSRTSDFSPSQDGENIAFITFSNVEEDYGYSLYTEDRTGKKVKKLATFDVVIRNPVWNSDNSKIAVVRQDADGKSEIIVINSSTGKYQSTYHQDEIIYSILWDGRKILYSGKKGSGSEIVAIDELGSKKLYFETKTGSIYFPRISNDQKNLAFLKTNSSNKYQDNVSGDIYIFNISEEKLNNIATGSYILGWLTK